MSEFFRSLLSLLCPLLLFHSFSLSLSLFAWGPSLFRGNYNAASHPRLAREGRRGRVVPSRGPGEEGRLGPAQGIHRDEVGFLIGKEALRASSRSRRALAQARGRDIGIERRCVR